MMELFPETAARASQDYLGHPFLVRKVDDGSNYIRRLQPYKFSPKIDCQIDVVEQSAEVPGTDLLKRFLRGLNVNRVPNNAVVARFPPSFA